MSTNTMPTTLPELQREVLRLQGIIASHERAKADRLKAEQAAADSPAANYEMELFDCKRELEGLADGSEDYESASERGRICRRAIGLLERMHRELPKA